MPGIKECTDSRRGEEVVASLDAEIILHHLTLSLYIILKLLAGQRV